MTKSHTLHRSHQCAIDGKPFRTEAVEFFLFTCTERKLPTFVGLWDISTSALNFWLFDTVLLLLLPSEYGVVLLICRLQHSKRLRMLVISIPSTKPAFLLLQHFILHRNFPISSYSFPLNFRSYILSTQAHVRHRKHLQISQHMV